MSNAIESIVAIATAITGVAILAVLVSKRADTANVIRAAGSAFSGALGVAVSPVTGSTAVSNTYGYGSSGFSLSPIYNN